MSPKRTNQHLERLLREGDWPRARHALKAQLVKQPESHWLLTMVGLTYYEQSQFRRALRYARKAAAIEPRCSLVRDKLALTLWMLNQDAEAIGLWKGLIRDGPRRLSRGRCRESLAWNRTLVNDCRLMLAKAYFESGDVTRTRRYLGTYLRVRRSGVRTWIPRDNLARFLRRCGYVSQRT